MRTLAKEFGRELRLHLWRIGQLYGRKEAERGAHSGECEEIVARVVVHEQDASRSS